MKHSLLEVLKRENQPIKRVGNGTHRINPCPVCGKNDHFTYYEATDSYSSHSGCCKGGDLYNYLQEVGQAANYQEALDLLEGNGVQKVARQSAVQTTGAEECTLNFTEFIHEIHKQGNHEYFHKRGLSQEIINEYKLGFLLEGLGTVAEAFNIKDAIKLLHKRLSLSTALLERRQYL
ncbi:hypothetical protein IEQ_04869 [Bacillus cereus BAG6X1-2]|nr:hypothetical protein IEQ_04869 [Bacillus cereus BAG6X1-2]